MSKTLLRAVGQVVQQKEVSVFLERRIGIIPYIELVKTIG
jgi:hypothetical protein